MGGGGEGWGFAGEDKKKTQPTKNRKKPKLQGTEQRDLVAFILHLQNTIIIF